MPRQPVIYNAQKQAVVNCGLSLPDIDLLIKALRALEDPDTEDMIYRLTGKRHRIISAVMRNEVQQPHRAKGGNYR